MNKKNWLNEPIVTYGILLIQIGVFIMQYLFPQMQIESRFGMHAASLLYGHEFWRLITPMFVHFGLMHIVVNSVVLYYMGKQCEWVFGHLRFLIVYLLSGMMGNLFSMAFNNPQTLSAGSSTAVFGLFGAFLIAGRHFPENPAMQMMVKQFGMFVILNFVFDLVDTTIDIWGHLGGLVGGALVAYMVAMPKAKGRFTQRSRITATLFFIFFIVVLCMWAFRKYGIAFQS